MTKLFTKDILEEVLLLYEKHILTEGKELIIESGCPDIIIETDRTILRRVLGNLTKNALEACHEGETVSISCSEDDSKVTFSVKNPNYIPRNIQLQIFQRSFSTKGKGRGIGTYSVKLLTEKYLNGSVNFESSKIDGTKFMVTYPITS
ncbi:MAG: HAMP domain-containing histidine kinase [Ignavibacteriae bacterium]|nr:HAMP domain-containing histidine kinase [Ignavibacteriota bacterium]